jgi:glycosyltransferase involved in cell wall biosynthesis
MGGRDTLVLLPALAGCRRGDGSVVLTRKFITGATAMAESWGGPVRVVVEPAPVESDNLDNVAVMPSDLPFELRVIDYASPELGPCLGDAAAVLAATHYRQNHVADLCVARGVGCVYVAEYTLRTRMDIVRSRTRNPLLRARRFVWELGQERKQRRALRLAKGVHCIGTPTYEAYRRLNANAELFFETRCTREDVISPEALAARLALMAQPGSPLRLAFSGRLLPMKGVDYLPSLATALLDAGVDFVLDVCGDGVRAGWLRDEVCRRGLEQRVRLRGVLDFASELNPFMRERVDLFVCPHVQGDPSGTYLEVFAAGVPIVGFANEAFLGLVQRVPAGWAVPMRDVRVLAATVAGLSRDRSKLAAAARQARTFALDHTFDETVRRRMEHVRLCTDAAAPRPTVPAVAEPARSWS